MRQPPRRRFWSKASRSPGCWEWMASKNSDGYGNFRLRSRHCGAHRAAWALVHGEIPVGMQVLHQCDNPGCVNPAHLFLGTQVDNIRDMDNKGRRRKVHVHPSVCVPGCMPRGEGHVNSTITENVVREIRSLREEGLLYKEISKRLRVSMSNVGGILRGERWGHVK